MLVARLWMTSAVGGKRHHWQTSDPLSSGARTPNPQS